MIIGTDFRGSDLSDIECDALALDRVSGSLLKLEPALVKTAWFDYRLMHPTKRTYLFAHFYEEAYKFMLRLHVDYKQAEGPSPRTYLPRMDPLGKTQAELRKEEKTGVVKAFRRTTMVWKARQKADELGIPYDTFTMSGMKAAVGRIWQRTPSPAQLYTQEILNVIIERWAEVASQRMFVASDPFYEGANWVGHPAQQEHAQWLVDQIMCRARPELALSQYGFGKQMIPRHMVAQAFPRDVIIAASRLSKNLL